MTVTDPDLRALRDALLPAIERDLAQTRRRPGHRLVIPLAVCGTLAAGTGLAAATGVLFSDPKPSDVPSVPEWQYFSHDPSDPTGKAGPVLRRPRPEAMARANRATEAELQKHGIAARCGSFDGHPLACHLPSGDPVPSPAIDDALYESGALRELESSPANYEVRRLTEAEARAWLCEHPDTAPENAVPEDC